MKVEDFLETYVKISDPQLQSDIASRHEFEEIKLERTEQITGDLLNHQRIVQRLVNPWTPYTSQLVDHKMGTGKTQLAGGVAEMWIDTIDSMRLAYEGQAKDVADAIPRKRVLVLTKNTKLENNFRTEIASVYAHKYGPKFEPGETETQAKRDRRTNAALNKNYEFMTFRTFASLVDRNMSNADFLKNYGNRLIIVDEAHGLRPQTKTDIPYYTEFELFILRNNINRNDAEMVNDAARRFLRESGYESKLQSQLARAVISSTKKVSVPKFYSDFIKFTQGKDIGDREDALRISLREYITFADIEPSADDIETVVKEFLGKNRSDMEVYMILHRFFHGIQKPRILLLTGTPMFDVKNEISYIANLILPDGQQMSHDPSDDEIREKMRGRVTYLRNMVTELPKVDEGSTKFTKYMKIVPLEMSEFQQKAYQKAYKIDTEEMSKSGKSQFAFYQNSRQAADAVFPDGSWGIAGHKKYSDKKNLPAFQEAVREDLAKYSIKMAKVMNDLEQFPRELAYIFSDKVSGSGIDFMEMVLQAYGFRKSVGNEQSVGLRYAVITGKTSSAETTRILRTFNSPENKTGKYIRLIIGSKSASEGLSYLNILRTYLFGGMWNNSSMEQAIARSIRLNAQSELIKEFGIENLKIRIFRLASYVRKHPDDSIDIKLYRLAEEKDIGILRVERILKEVSIDCILTKDRNLLPQDVDGSRECEYMNCDYKCSDEGSAPMPTNYNTWTQHYSKREIEQLQQQIHDLLMERKVVEVTTLAATTMTVRDIAVSEYLKRNTFLSDKQGVSYKIAYSSPFILLVPAGYTSGLDGAYYAKHIQLQKKIPLSMLGEYRGRVNDTNVLDTFCSTGNERNMEKLSIASQVELIQYAIKHRKSSDSRVKSILRIFQDVINLEEKSHSVTGQTIRLVDGEWVAADEEEKEQKKTTKKRKPATKNRSLRELSEEQVFGVMDGDDFYIVDKRFDAEATHGKSGLNTGRLFSHYTKLDLIQMLKYEGVPMRKTQVKLNVPELKAQGKASLASQIEMSDKKSYNRMFIGEEDKFTIDDLIYILSWSISPKTTKRTIGDALKEVFEKKGKLIALDG